MSRHEMPDRPRVTRRGFLLGGAAVISVGFGTDMASHPFLKDDFYSSHIDSPGDTLSVFHPGMFADVRFQTQPLIPEASLHGPSLLIGAASTGSYSGDKHVELTVETVTRRLKCNRELRRAVFNGISIGGTTSTDSIEELERLGVFDKYEATPYLTLFDAPTSLGDTSFSGTGFATHYPSGIVSNGIKNLADRLGYHLVPVDPDKDIFGDGIDMELWAKSQQASNNVPLSLIIDQARHLEKRSSPTTTSVNPVRSTVFIASEKDEIVNHKLAIPKWEAAASEGKFKNIGVPNAPHGAIVNFPNSYRSALAESYNFHRE